jgi:hypothetical protein
MADEGLLGDRFAFAFFTGKVYYWSAGRRGELCD